jgi:hypothetical protein
MNEVPVEMFKVDDTAYKQFNWGITDGMGSGDPDLNKLRVFPAPAI